METSFHLLSLITFLPAVAGLALAPVRAERSGFVRWGALAASFAVVAMAALAWAGYDGTSTMNFVEDYDWVRKFDIHYKMGLDGISLALVALTAILMPMAIAASWKQSNGFLVALLFLETGMLGAFCALDLFLF